MASTTKGKGKSVKWQSYDLDSPTDFTNPHLQIIDQSLRCSICAEHYLAPAILTSCSHSFCSKCLRESIAIKSNCPECSKETDEGRIRKNIALEQVVLSWRKARASLLELQASANRTLVASSHISSESESEQQQPALSRRTTRASTSSAKSKAKKWKGKSDEIVLDSSDIEVMEVPSKSGAGTMNAKRMRKGKSPSKVPEDDPNLIVTCPICQGQYKNSDIFAHSSKCDGKNTSTSTNGGKNKDAWFKLMDGSVAGKDDGGGKPRSPSPDIDQKMPLTSYANMKLKDLRLLLEKVHLPLTLPTPTSDKLTIYKRRHKQFVTLFNANVDLSWEDDRKKKKAAELREELRVWEKVMDGDAGKESLGKTYEMENESEFKRLIRLARESSKKAQLVSVVEAPVKEEEMIDDAVLETAAIGDEAEDEGAADVGSPSSSSSSSPPSSSFKRKRSLSPFNPEGPRPSQRVREVDFAHARKLQLMALDELESSENEF